MKRFVFLVGVLALGIVAGAMIFRQMEFTEVFAYRFTMASLLSGIVSGHVVLSISVLLLAFLLFRCVTLEYRKQQKHHVCQKQRQTRQP